MIYADTNVFTRVYLNHSETPEAQRIVQESSLPWTVLHALEFPNAIWRTVFDGRNRGQEYIDENQALLILADNEQKYADREGLHPLAIEWEVVLPLCRQISDRYAARHGFRVLDILHVATAIETGHKTFASFDVAARRLAKLEGMNLRPVRTVSDRK